jgi:GT2 family glycosyltransferase
LTIKVSIIVPTYCRPKQLSRCLEGIAGLKYPRESFEVLVVDDGSVTPPQEVVRTFALSLDIKLITQSHSGPAAARNMGAQNARGELLAFTDDDCAPSAGWLGALASQQEHAPGCAVGGHTINALVENPYSAASQMLIDYLYSYFNVDGKEATFFTSNNFCVPAEQFRAIGGFDTNFPLAAGEDREFCHRWLDRGYRMIYASEAKVYHFHALRFRTFWRQHFNYGRAAHFFWQIRRRRNRERIQLEPLRFYTDMVRHPFSHGQDKMRFRFIGLLLLSQAANAAGFLWEKLTVPAHPRP